MKRIILDYDINGLGEFLREAAQLCNEVSSQSCYEMAVPGNLYQLAFEHCDAITILLKENATSSAMALYRPALEAYCRGAWALYCDSHDFDSLEIWNSGFKRLSEITCVINKKAPGHVSQILQDALDAIPQGVANCLTHGGKEQILNRLVEGKIRANFSAENIRAVIYASLKIAAGSAVEMARIAEDVDTAMLVVDAYDAACEYLNRHCKGPDQMPQSVFHDVRTTF